MQVAPLDCLGCGVCEDVCPTKTKSLVMQPIASQYDQIENWEYAAEKSKESLGIPADNVNEQSVQNALSRILRRMQAAERRLMRKSSHSFTAIP